MTKQEFITAAKNVTWFHYGVRLPLTEENLLETEDCKYYFIHEIDSDYDDNDDNLVDCVYWYSVSAYRDSCDDGLFELAMGVDGRRGDHFWVNCADWQKEK